MKHLPSKDETLAAGLRYSTLSLKEFRPSFNGRPGEVHRLSNLKRKSLSPWRTVFSKITAIKFKRKRSDTRGVLVSLLCGLFAVALGTVLVTIDPFQIFLRMKVLFSPGGETFLTWEHPQIRLMLKVYLFNVTNADEFLRGDAKLRFEQVGPYVYREGMDHANATFNPNGTISFIPKHPLKFIPELSNGTEEDIVIMPNIALLSIAHIMSQHSVFTRMGLNVLIRQTKTQPLVPMTAREFMFGYRSTLVTLGNKLLPSWIYFDKVGLIDRMYDFEGDTATVFTGEFNKTLSGLIDNYNGHPYLAHWPAPCNNVTGASDGTKFNSYITKGQELLFYRKSLCRSVPLVRTTEEVHQGIQAARYLFKNFSLDNGQTNPINSCFCRNGFCLPPGIIDVTDCYYGFPIALSYPHYLDTDQSVLDAIDGVHPNRDLHTTFFVVNEASGLPVTLSVKMQINMAFGDTMDKIVGVGRFKNMIIPMLWTDILMEELPTILAWKFWFYLTVGPPLLDFVTYFLLVGGLAFVLLSLSSAIFIPTEGKSNLTKVTSDTMPPAKELELFLPPTNTNASNANNQLNTIHIDR